MPATVYFENLIFRYAISGETFVIDSWYLALYSNTTATTEITSASYMRQLVTWSASYANTNTITFPSYSGAGNVVEAVGLCDTSVSGNLLAFQAISPNITLGAGTVVNVAPGVLILDILNS